MKQKEVKVSNVGMNISHIKAGNTHSILSSYTPSHIFSYTLYSHSLLTSCFTFSIHPLSLLSLFVFSLLSLYSLTQFSPFSLRNFSFHFFSLFIYISILSPPRCHYLLSLSLSPPPLSLLSHHSHLPNILFYSFNWLTK